MNNIKKPYKFKKYSLNEQSDFQSFLGTLSCDGYLIFKELSRDTVGRSNSNPTWGYVYEYVDGELDFKGIGLHKEYDYDFPYAAYAEKVWSIIGQSVLNNVRIPNISVVEELPGFAEVISYRLMDNDKEDLIHMKDILFNKFLRNEIQEKKDIFDIQDILDCVKLQVKDKENYKIIEEAIMQALLLDSITNNGDRHTHNWALIRNKLTNYYDLALFDHSSSFVDMFQEQRHFTVNGWVSSYITFDNKSKPKTALGESGNVIVNNIYKKYPKYFNNFITNFNKEFDNFCNQIYNENLDINMNFFLKRLKDKKNFLDKLQTKGEKEYE